MTAKLKVRGNNVKVDPSTLIGEGGEAEVFRISGDTVLKLYKAPTAEHEAKLLSLPSFPPCVVAPAYLCYDDAAKIAGYTMPLIENAYHLKSLFNRDFREKAGIDRKAVIDLFREIHSCVASIHQANITIGDFNPLNVLIDTTNCPRFLDADSMQFGGFVCKTFTTRYVDPLRCDPSASSLELIHLHDEKTDWYAFALMFFEALLYVHPYGGVYKPKGGTKLSQDMRCLKRITVFDSEVMYPSAAEPLTSLPADVLDYYQALLHKDRRGTFPTEVFASLRGYRVVTPPPQRIHLPQVKGTMIFITTQQGREVYVYHDNGAFYREDGTAIMTGALDPRLHFTIHDRETIVTRGGDSYRIKGGQVQRFPIELFRDQLPAVASNGRQLYWIAAGELWCEDRGRVRHIDSVIAKQTRIWAGPRFGVGLSTARGITRAFMFDNEHGQRIPVELPALNGVIKDAACQFNGDQADLFLTLSTRGTHHASTEDTIRITLATTFRSIQSR